MPASSPKGMSFVKLMSKVRAKQFGQRMGPVLDLWSKQSNSLSQNGFEGSPNKFNLS